MTTEARSLEQCVADARAILDEGALGPLGARGRLITLSRNTYSSLLDLVEALDAYVNLIGGRLPRKVERALTDVHESLQENLPR